MMRTTLNTPQGARRRLAYQRGVTAIITSVMLLFAASIAVLYLNRSLIFEQRTSANYTRSTTAFEMAEAGIEWATGMINSPYDINTSCAAQTTTVAPFLKKYVLTQWGVTATSTYVVSATTTFPGCKVSGTTLTCSCPDVVSGATTVAALGTSTLPGFTVAFSDVSGDSESVSITATGCTDTASACTPGNASTADANATVRVILKMRPTLRAAPASALTCGSSCNVSGSFNIINTDLATNGVLVNAGGSISGGNGSSSVSLPGIPATNAMVSYDSSLSALASSDSTCSNSAMFQSFFGSTIEEYQNLAQTKSISCTSASDCGTQVLAAFSAGSRMFYFPLGFSWNNSAGSDLGSLTDPVTIVTPGNADISTNGNLNIYGMVFSNDSTLDHNGTGTADVIGAFVSCRDYTSNGNGTIRYDADVLTAVRRSSAILVRVPGSWRDW